MEVAGLALSIGASFSLCCQGYGILSSLLRAKGSLSRTKCRFDIQHARFLAWGRSWGLNDDDGSPVASSGTLEKRLLQESASVSKIIQSVLAEISIILLDGRRLEDQYGLHHVESGACEENVSRSATLTKRVIQLPFRRKIETEFREQQRTMDALKRFKWAIRDKSAFLALVNELKELNDGLYDLVPAQGQGTLVQAVNAQLLANTVERAEIQVVEEAAEQSYPLLQATARLKLAGVEADQPPVTLTTTLQLCLESTQIILHEDMGSRSAMLTANQHTRVFAAYRPEPLHVDHGSNFTADVEVLVEWKAYNPHAQGRRAFANAFRANGLARLLSVSTDLSDTRTLQCLGYFDDGGRFGFVFQLPAAGLARGAQAPTTLNQIIGMYPQLPPLETRFKLALQLTKTLYNFHCAKWLHKDFSSHNIVFAGAASTTDDDVINGPGYDLTEPYVVGFSYSRPEDHENLSSEAAIVNADTADYVLYQHESYVIATNGDSASISTQQHPRRFCRAFDVYALGCVLLEIGLWRRLADLWKPAYANQPWKWKDRLLNVWVNELSGRCGGTYETIVRRCLTVQEENAEETSDAAGLVDFSWDVIMALEGLKV